MSAFKKLRGGWLNLAATDRPANIERKKHLGQDIQNGTRSTENGTAYIPSRMVSSVMPLPNIISLLTEHGCKDVTPTLDLSGYSEHPISMGGFGDVYRGRLINGHPVAIKCMRMVVGSVPGEQQKHLKYAAREIHTWSKLDHRYISKLIGLAQFRGQVAMISSWAARGSLPVYLTGNTKVDRPLLCTQIAEGLAFLHKSGIVHGDLKGANILISDAHEPMLTDFGNAVLLERTLRFTDTSSKRNLSLRWAAPELLEDDPYSREADVYALGMTILEIITGKMPYDGMRDVSVVRAIISGQHPKRTMRIPSECESGDLLWTFLARCWAFSPGSRPTALEAKELMATVSLVTAKGAPLVHFGAEGKNSGVNGDMYKARALYAYTASPDDPAEISFLKGEVLNIIDNTEKWWKARKADGTTGIVPSNYLQPMSGKDSELESSANLSTPPMSQVAPPSPGVRLSHRITYNSFNDTCLPNL